MSNSINNSAIDQQSRSFDEMSAAEYAKDRNAHYLNAAKIAREEAYALAIVFGGADSLVAELFKKAEKYDEAARLWKAATKMRYFSLRQLYGNAPEAMFV